MAAALPLEERALILAPATLGAQTLRVLTQAGITCRRTCDMHRLGRWLGDGAGLLVIAEQALPDNRGSPLHRFLETQPQWSDLPIVLLANRRAGTAADSLGNLLALAPPYPDAQLARLAWSALRTRRWQYQARDLRNQLEIQLQRQQIEEQTRKLEAIGQLAGGVAHDFNNLLTSIGGSLELIDRRLRQGKAEQLAQPLQMGRQAVARAARLTQCLLAFSARQSLRQQAVDLQALLAQAPLQRRLSASVELMLHVPDDLWPACADREQLQASLDSLVLNACEAMPSGGVLHIEARNVHHDGSHGLALGDYLCLSIRDSGQGMSPATLEHAVEPFFTTKPVGQGIGLGLSMVYGFSRQSRGHLVLQSQIGTGTTVQLYLPRHQCSAPPRPAGTPARRAKAGERHILLVEDDPGIRQLAAQAMDELGLPCTIAHNAHEALRSLESAQAFGLMISDVGLPGMNGRQLAEIARTLRPALPVLFITGYAETAMARDDFLGPGMQLLSKPFELAQLCQRIEQMLG